ncbi:tRNA methyltransferase 10 C [Bulinus truncatus]|nr:tRNA methyltransferase 10 C [Bulinus truncatus]
MSANKQRGTMENVPEVTLTLCWWTNNKLASAMQFGIPLVIDMGFSVSNLTELIPLGQQIWNLYCSNRRHSNPFHLVFTNCSQANDIIRYLELHHFVESSMILASFTEKSHLDLFSHSKLVYLSSQAKKCVQAFDLNKVYILGAYHDPLVRKKSSYSRSREQNILSLCLPINQQVKWSHQLHKDLDLHHIINILLSVKESNCWKTAFVSTVPDFVAEVL